MPFPVPAVRFPREGPGYGAGRRLASPSQRTRAAMGKEQLEALLTPADVAERCQVSAKTVIRAIRAGRLRAYRLGTRGAYRLRADDVEAWLAESAVQTVVVPLPVRQPLPSTPHRPAPTAGGRLRVPRSVGG